MDGDGKGGLQLPQHIGGILHDLAVEIHGDLLLVDGTDHTHVAVEHPHAGLQPLLVPPEDIVVVFHLHDPVPRAEDPVSEAALPLVLPGRVQGLLKDLIETFGPRPPAAGGREHLDLVGGDAQPFGQTAAAQVHHRVQRSLGVPADHEEKVVVVAPQVGGNPLIDHVGVADDVALGGLPEDLGQTHRGDHPAADQVGEEVARTHGGQLVRVPHQHQPAVPGQGGEQGGHEDHIHHGGLVHDDGIHIQGIIAVVGKDQLPRLGVKARFQQAVDGGRLGAAQLPQPLGSSSCGGSQGGLHSHGFEEGQHTLQAGGLARTGAAGEEHHLPVGRRHHCLHLLRGILDALLPLDIPQKPVQLLGGEQFLPAHLDDAACDKLLGLVELGQIDRVLSGDLLPLDLSPALQLVQCRVQKLSRQTQQDGGGLDELPGGEEGMSVVQVVGQLEQQPRLQTQGVLRLHPQ